MAIRITFEHCPGCRGRGIVTSAAGTVLRCEQCRGGRDAPVANMGAYQRAFEWAKKVGFDTSGGSRMGKLLLSLYNPAECPVSIAACVDYLDDEGRELALRAVAQFMEMGENEDLGKVGKALRPHFEQFLAVSQAAVQAQQVMRLRMSEERAGS